MKTKFSDKSFFECAYLSFSHTKTMKQKYDEKENLMIPKKCIKCNHFGMMRIDANPICIGCDRGEFF